jgi:hypothetical protein
MMITSNLRDKWKFTRCGFRIRKFWENFEHQFLLNAV